MTNDARMRVWGYATDDGHMALTTDPDKAAEWRVLFKQRDLPGPFEFVLIPSVQTWHQSKAEMATAREIRRR